MIKEKEKARTSPTFEDGTKLYSSSITTFLPSEVETSLC